MPVDGRSPVFDYASCNFKASYQMELGHQRGQDNQVFIESSGRV